MYNADCVRIVNTTAIMGIQYLGTYIQTNNSACRLFSYNHFGRRHLFVVNLRLGSRAMTSYCCFRRNLYWNACAKGISRTRIKYIIIFSIILASWEITSKLAEYRRRIMCSVCFFYRCSFFYHIYRFCVSTVHNKY